MLTEKKQRVAKESGAAAEPEQEQTRAAGPEVEAEQVRETEQEAEAEQVSLPQAAQVSIVVDTPGPSLRIKEEPQALLRNRTDHIETIGLKLRVTRGDSFRRRCATTFPLSHIRADIVRRFGAARRFLAVGSTVGIRPP